MLLPNHLAGGFVFTGFFASLAGINVLDSPHSLLALALGAALPDIDHPRSLIGRLIPPLARAINRRFGHRTLTHSLSGLFLFSVASALVEQAFFQRLSGSVIASLAYLSHLFLDMMTLQGVQLFYPVFKNACVLPGQAGLRMRTGDLRSEGLVFCVCLILAFSMQDLFRQGFWNTYNRTFGSVKHLASEFVKSPFLIHAAFDYREGSRWFHGAGYCIEATADQATLITDQGTFLRLDDAKQVVQRIVPTRTSRRFRFETLSLHSLPLDSLNALLHRKLVLELLLYCPSDFIVLDGNGASLPSKSFSGKYLDYPQVQGTPHPTPAPTPDSFIPESDPRIALLYGQKRLLLQQERLALDAFAQQQGELQRLVALAADSSADLFVAQQRVARIQELRKVEKPASQWWALKELDLQILWRERELATRNLQKQWELAQKQTPPPPEPLFSGLLRVVYLY